MRKETWSERYLSRDLVDTMSKWLSGGLVAASSLLGIPAVIITSALSAGVAAFFTRQDIRFKETQYLNLYKNELSVLMHKSPDSLTLDDLETAAKPIEQDGFGIVALRKQMDFLHYRERFSNLANVGTTALLAAALIGVLMLAPPLLTQFNFLVTTVIGGAGISFLQKASRNAADVQVRDYGYKFSINKHLLDITTELEQKPVQPTRILGLFIAADPALNNYIEQTYGEQYERLSFAKKAEVLAALESQLRVDALTHEINAGAIRPSIIGFIAYGQELAGSPDFEKYRNLRYAASPWVELSGFNNNVQQDHAIRLAEQRSISTDHTRLH